MSKDKKQLVPVRRFKEFENSGAWEQCKLKDVANFFDNQRIPVTASKRIGGKTPYYGANGIQDYVNGFTHNGEYILVAEDGANDVKHYPVDYVSGKVWINNHAHVAQAKSNKAWTHFLKYRISSMYLVPFLVGGGRYKLNGDVFQKLPIIIPDISEQKKVSNYFSFLDNLIASNQRKLDKLKRVKSAYLTEMFPAEGEREPKRRFPGFTGAWEQQKLGDVAERFDNLRIPVTASKRVSGNTPYYGANGVQDYVSGYTHSGEFVLVAEDGANDLQNYPVHYVNGKVWVNNHSHVIRGKSGVANNLFLLNAIKKIKFETYLVGGSRAKLNANIMMKLPIRIPSFTEQQKLGRYFSKLDSLIDLHQRKLDKLKKLKAAYLNEMFV